MLFQFIWSVLSWSTTDGVDIDSLYQYSCTHPTIQRGTQTEVLDLPAGSGVQTEALDFPNV